MKTKIVLTCLLLLIVFNGCILMSADQKAALVNSSIVVNALNDKCQAGDAVACQKGLAEAAKTLNLIVADIK